MTYKPKDIEAFMNNINWSVVATRVTTPAPVMSVAR